MNQFLCQNCQEPLTSITYVNSKMVLLCKKCGRFLECAVELAEKPIIADRSTRDHIKCLGE